MMATSKSRPTGTQNFSMDDLKELIADRHGRIRLDDIATSITKATIAKLSVEHFPVQGPHADSDVQARVAKYEEVTAELQALVVLLARWAEPDQVSILAKIFARLVDAERPSGGLTWWVYLTWYPVLKLMYAAGIAALSAGRYDIVAAILATKVAAKSGDRSQVALVGPVLNGLSEINDAFKRLQGRERAFVPRSEHLFVVLQSPLDDALWLGSSYEPLFDSFEILLALTFVDQHQRAVDDFWGPPGRFGWKHRPTRSPYDEFVSEAKRMGDDWGPVRSGLFSGKITRFLEIAEGYRRFLSKLNWY